MDTDHKQKMDGLKDFGIKILAVIGFITLLAIGTWGSVQVARQIPNALSTLTATAINLNSRFFPAVPPASDIIFTVETGTIVSGESFVLTWENEASSGIYEFSYACDNGFHFETEAGESISCDEPFAFINTENTLTLVPVSKENLFLDVLVTLSFIADEGAENDAANTFLLTVVNENLSTSRGAMGGSGAPDPLFDTQVSQDNTTVVGGGVAALFGLPDLAVIILEFGTIDKNTGDFVATSTVVRGNKAVVRFEISNVGTNVSGLWNFRAILPTTSVLEYEPNELQSSLSPGERILYTISFDRLAHATEGLFTIEIDPDSLLNEITRTNNKAEITIGIQKTKE